MFPTQFLPASAHWARMSLSGLTTTQGVPAYSVLRAHATDTVFISAKVAIPDAEDSGADSGVETALVPVLFDDQHHRHSLTPSGNGQEGESAQRPRSAASDSADSFVGPHLLDVLRSWDITESTLSWSLPRLELLLGYTPSSVSSSIDWWRERIHADDRPRVLRSLQRFIKNETLRFWAEEYRMLAADGLYATVVDQMRVQWRDPSTGRAVKCVGIMFNPVQKQQVENILQGERTQVLRDVQQRWSARARMLQSVTDAGTSPTIPSSVDSCHLQKQRLSDSVQLLQTVTDNSTSGLFMMDSNGHPTFMNRAAELLTGWTLDEIKHQPLHFSVHAHKPDGSPYPLEDCPVDNCQADLRAQQNQTETFCDRWGRFFPVVWSVAPLRKGGHPFGAVIEFRDVTHEQQMERDKLKLLLEKEAEKAKAVQTDSHRAKMAQFVDYVCHEVRNPLHGIAASAEFLEDCVRRLEAILAPLSLRPAYPPCAVDLNLPDDEPLKAPPTVNTVITTLLTEVQAYIRSIKECCNHQTLITNNVLDLSRLQAGKVELLSEVFEPSHVAAKCFQMLTAQIAAKRIKANLHVYDGTHLVKGDAMRYSQVIMNLTTNAIKFTQPGKSVAIIVDAPYPESAEGDPSVRLRTAVVDTGIGMDEGEVQHLFQRFEQLNKTISRDYGGSGLGLNISRELVNLLGGEFHVRSKKGKGTEMEFVVKMRKIEPADEQEWRKRKRATDDDTGCEKGQQRLRSNSSASDEASTKRPHEKYSHVLVVEDNVINQMVLATYLKKLKYSYSVCSNGQEAVDRVSSLTEEPVDAIIMDIEMPVMDGHEATRLIRKMEHAERRADRTPTHRPPLTIIALSGNAQPRQMQKAYETGLDDCLTKPCSQTDIQKMLLKWENLRRR